LFRSTTGLEIPLVCKPKCRFCSKPVPDEYALYEQCKDCTIRLRNGKGLRSRPYSFVKVVCAGMYVPDTADKGFLGRLVLKMKDGSDHSRIISEAMKFAFEEELGSLRFDVIVPIPPKLNGRGPTHRLCEHLSRSTGIPIVETIRFKYGVISSKDLSGDKKFDNARDNVDLNDISGIRSKEVLLVDDIITTCGTAHWCSSELLKNGAVSVHVLSACRTVRKEHLDFIGYNGIY
jgi:predicted amidophosphoribosyltransferase